MSRYSWTQSEIEELKKASLVLAADVIYSDDLTDAFFSILNKLMLDNPEKVPWMKREYSALFLVMVVSGQLARTSSHPSGIVLQPTSTTTYYDMLSTSFHTLTIITKIKQIFAENWN